MLFLFLLLISMEVSEQQAAKQFRLERCLQDQLKINCSAHFHHNVGLSDCFLIDFGQECRVASQQSNQAEDIVMTFVTGLSSLLVLI